MNYLITIILSILSFVAYAEIHVHVQPSQISSFDTFQLTLKQESPKDGSTPDLSVLQQDFNIVGTQQSSMYSMINGQTKTSRQWIISLRPRKSGLLTIPAIALGSEQTKPMTIKVGAGSGQNQTNPVDTSQQKEVMLKTEVSKKNPFVNQQILYTVKLYNSKRLLDAEYQGPQVEDALMFPLGNGKRYQILKNNIDYMVEEQNYAIFPQKSGTLKITSPSITALVYDYTLHKITSQDKPLKLEVAPIPSNYKGKEWLPAKHLSLTEHYEDNNSTLSQGSTLIRNITIQGEALPAQLLPQLHFEETDSMSVYPEKGKDHNQIKQGELVGSTTFKLTYLFKKPGKIMIPAIQIPWFNTETGKEEWAVLPPRPVEITPTLAVKPDSTPQNVETASVPAKAPPLTPPKWPEANHWAVLALALALVWILTLVAWQWPKGRPQRGKKTKLKRQLTKACMENNPVKTRDALLKWASCNWPDALIVNLNDIHKFTKDASLKKQLHLLSEALYGHKGSSWQGWELLQSIQTLKPTSYAKENKDILPPINPIN